MLINGVAEGRVSALDRGLQYGDGLFETLAVAKGVPCLWDRHMRRLADGCTRLGLPRPVEGWLREQAHTEIGSRERAVLKIILTRGSGPRGYAPPTNPAVTCIVNCSPWAAPPAAAGERGATVRFCQTRLGRNPRLAGIKHLNRLEQVLARSEWQDPGIAEGLMLDSEGHVVEGTASNLFVLDRGRLLTPALEQCGVAGVIRELVMETAASLGIPVECREISPAELERAEALFLTNSLIGISWVRSLEGRLYYPEALPRTLREAVEERRLAP